MVAALKLARPPSRQGPERTRPRQQLLLVPAELDGHGEGFALNDLMPDCPYGAKGDSEGEVLIQAAEHARTPRVRATADLRGKTTRVFPRLP